MTKGEIILRILMIAMAATPALMIAMLPVIAPH